MKSFSLLLVLFIFNTALADVRSISLLEIEDHFTSLDNSELKSYLEDRYYNDELSQIEIQTILNSVENATEETKGVAIELFAEHGLVNEAALLMTKKENETYLGPNIANELMAKYIFSGENQAVIYNNSDLVTDILLSWRYPENLNDLAAGRGLPKNVLKSSNFIYQLNNKIWGSIDSNIDLVTSSDEVKVTHDYECKAELTKHKTVNKTSKEIEIDSMCKIYKANILMEKLGRSTVRFESKINHNVDSIGIWAKSAVVTFGGRTFMKEDYTSKVTLNHNIKVNIPKCNNIFECFPVVKVFDNSTRSHEYRSSVMQDGLKLREYTVVRSKNKEVIYGMNFKDTHTGSSSKGHRTTQNFSLNIQTSFVDEELKDKSTDELFDHFQFLVELSVKNKNTDDFVRLGQLANEVAKRCNKESLNISTDKTCFNGLYNLLSSASHYESKIKDVKSDVLYLISLIRASAQSLFKELFYNKLKKNSIASFNDYISILEQIKHDSKLFQELLMADLLTTSDNNQLMNILDRYSSLQGSTNLLLSDANYFLNLNKNERRELLGALIRYLESSEYFYRNDFYNKVKLLGIIEKEEEILNFDEYLNSVELVIRGLE